MVMDCAPLVLVARLACWWLEQCNRENCASGWSIIAERDGMLVAGMMADIVSERADMLVVGMLVARGWSIIVLEAGAELCWWLEQRGLTWWLEQNCVGG
ncbi:unnamed protein product [Sphenostylis stenocarpa]|uniref:RNase H type-1 domain-containing protein n=1 Tax=Sphenostylis stenocarpa TaxID=92480 RepID=A0AA86SQY6_9FABA|nr:unnamed protein product [Sphenostylis stenocarpa]